MTLILLNCVFLAMDSKAPGFEETTRGCASPPAPRANSAPSQRSHFNAKIDRPLADKPSNTNWIDTDITSRIAIG